MTAFRKLIKYGPEKQQQVTSEGKRAFGWDMIFGRFLQQHNNFNSATTMVIEEGKEKFASLNPFT